MNTMAYFGLPGGTEIILILFIILLLFGAKRLPELSRALGKSLSEFKRGKEDLEREINEVKDDVHKAATEPEVEEVENEKPDDKSDETDKPV